MKRWVRDNRGFLVFMLLLGVFRTAVADWNPIPSGSMRPNLLDGDVVFVNRLAYNVKIPLTDVVLARTGEPRRGDVVTFSSPLDGTRLIKRLVALPGDVVSMRGKQLMINGQAAAYEPSQAGMGKIGEHEPVTGLAETLEDSTRVIQWHDHRAVASDFGPVQVPADHYLMLGDNRDSSADSRFIGLVPRHLLIGRAEAVLVSADITDAWQPRWSRFASRLN
jgi:signal peptidase I